MFPGLRWPPHQFFVDHGAKHLDFLGFPTSIYSLISEYGISLHVKFEEEPKSRSIECVNWTPHRLFTGETYSIQILASCLVDGDNRFVDLLTDFKWHLRLGPIYQSSPFDLPQDAMCVRQHGWQRTWCCKHKTECIGASLIASSTTF